MQSDLVLTFIDDVPIKRRFIRNLPFNPRLKLRARANRKAGVLAEIIFWKQVHKRKFFGIDFDRQRIIGNYIVDFYCKALGLIVEIDGTSHNAKVEYDTKRDNFLISLNLTVFHISSLRIENDLDNVMDELKLFIVKNFQVQPPRPSGSPPKEGRVRT